MADQFTDLNIFTQKPFSSKVKAFIDTLVEENTQGKSYFYNLKISGSPSYEKLKKESVDFRKEAISFMLQKLKSYGVSGWMYDKSGYVYQQTLTLMMRSNQNFDENDILAILRVLIYDGNNFYHWFPIYQTLTQLEKYARKNGLTQEARQFLYNLKDFSFPYREEDRCELKIKEILTLTGDVALQIAPVVLDDYDDFGKGVNAFTGNLEDSLKVPYYQFITLCKKTKGGKPSQKLYLEIDKIAQQIGTEPFKNQLKAWLLLFKQQEVRLETHINIFNGREYHHTSHEFLRPSNLDAIKVMVWAVKSFTDPEILQILGNLTEKCFTKIPNKGPLAAGVGNACIYTLAQSGLNGIAYLSRLKLRLRQSSTKEMIENYILEAAKEMGVTPSEIEDMAVPDFDLKEGKAAFVMGDYQAILSITGIGKTQIQWQKLDGTTLKSEPATVKKDFKTELKSLKDTAKQIQTMLTAQRDRLDRGLVEDRTLTIEQFENFYLNHGLMCFLTTQLIWCFEIHGKFQDAFYFNGVWVDVDEKPLENIESVQKVKLWHPIRKNIDDILDWRNFLAKHEIRQPLKQAYREIYLLTDAEVNTRNYSNRMAAHLLKQHQFNSLAKLRGWKYSLLGAYDKGYDTETATVQLPENYKAEFWVQEVYADGEWTDSGIYNYVSTDQVRFYRNGTQLEMTDIPALIFSEVMRDVDLFVGVASVGNDPNWRDGGLQQYRNYWESYSFGDLNELAKTRKQVLERIIPRLKIAKQCQITDKFLVVAGKIRTYKIHLGSGNILMEPNDQYLCIVPDRKSENLGDKVFLPFEGDNILSIIISKAFLLAEDTKITDTTILSQLER
ncbi:MAG: DUF4132 domain-containing protein [Microscillaceae bacterium]|nr:DUF4132 domain-containing protein [Microscillaceae bacterium]